MTNPGVSAPASWRHSSAVRFIGSLSSWLLFAFSLTLLQMVVVGGNCVSGPYETAVECPSELLLAPVGLTLGGAAFFASLVFARGFGAQTPELAAPVVWVGFSYAFLGDYFDPGSSSGLTAGWLVTGWLLEVVGALSIILRLIYSGQRMLVGVVTIDGVPFYDRKPDRKPLPGITIGPSETTVRAGMSHWALSLGIAVVASAAGYYFAQQLAATIV